MGENTRESFSIYYTKVHFVAFAHVVRVFVTSVTVYWYCVIFSYRNLVYVCALAFVSFTLQNRKFSLP